MLITGDGSHSLRSRQFAVPYHSTHGALNESKHVFIEMGLRSVLTTGVGEVNILEIGFGTGLNALLSWQLALTYPTIQFNFRTFEQYPISTATALALNYPQLLKFAQEDFMQLHTSPWNVPVRLANNFSFTKLQEDFFVGLNGHEQQWAHVIFYDAFAPASQPELWESEILQHCYDTLASDGVLVTYCAKGQFKRNLKSVGFQVEPLPGPPGKREMTRGRKGSLLDR